MSGLPLVSVVLATNRGGPLLDLTLDSLASQTWPNWELIVVDDGSPDPGEIDAAVSRIPDSTVVHQANSGVSMARNVGIARSRGRYLTFLDDDDLWAPERLTLQVEALEREPAAVASYCQWDIIDVRGDLVVSGDLGPGDLRAFLRHERQAPILTLLASRDAVDRIGWFHPMLPPGEDLDLIYRLARVGAFVFVPEVLVHYRRHGSNATNDTRAAALASRRVLWIQQWWSAHTGQAATLEDIRVGLRQSRRYWTEQALQAAWAQLRAGRYGEAGRNTAFVIRHDPVTGVRAAFRLIATRLSRSGTSPERTTQ